MMATKNPYQGDDLDFFAAARGEDGGIKKEAPKAAKPAAKKAPVVTKEQMQKAGFDNLRDYMNAKKGLTRRGEKAAPATPSLSASKQRDLDKTESRRAAQDNMRAIAASRAKKAADSKKAAESTSTGRDKMASASRLATKRERDFKNMQSGEFPSASNSRGNRKELETGPMKEGGKVKKYARGGGIELRGKTKCKII
jgi:hypothetical protein